jgi:hypothetical protein
MLLSCQVLGFDVFGCYSLLRAGGGVVLLLVSFIHVVDFSSVSLLSPVGGLMVGYALRCPVLLWSSFFLMMGMIQGLC